MAQFLWRRDVAGSGLRGAEQRRVDDTEEAGRIGALFGLGSVDEVVRQWQDRGGLIGTADFLALGAIVWGVGGTLFLVLPEGPESDKVVFGAFIGGVVVVAALLFVLGERFKVVRCRYFLYSGGVAQLMRRGSEPQILRWADVERVTIATTEDDDGNPETDLKSCILSGSATEITAGPGSAVFRGDPGSERRHRRQPSTRCTLLLGPDQRLCIGRAGHRWSG